MTARSSASTTHPNQASQFRAGLINGELAAAVAESQSFGATTRAITPADHLQLGALHDAVFGPGALTRTAYRIREGLPRQTPYCRVACNAEGQIIAFLRFTPVTIGAEGRVLMLGPLAVAPGHGNRGHARRLIADGLIACAAGGIRLIVLVGDLPYYGKIGFVPVPAGQITMPGPVDHRRLLAFEIEPGALGHVAGALKGDAGSIA